MATTSEFLNDWLASQQHRLRPTTLHSYKMAVARISSRLGKMPVQALTPLQIEKFYADLLSWISRSLAYELARRYEATDGLPGSR